ncbi:MAG TPA: trigger factor [Candidatus Saccharimonadales bacterium]|jgi:trigger factor
MQAHKTQLTDTRIKLTLEADQELLEEVRTATLKRLKREVKIPGFRAGKVPLELVEKNLNQQVLQQEFLDAALNRMYGTALTEQRIRPVSQPQVNIKKFVPFTTLEFEAELDVIGDVVLPDYTKVSLPKKAVNVGDMDVDEVIQNLRLRMAEKQPVERAAKVKDEVWIDFEGRDAKTDEPIKGGDGKDYPLVLGSNTFIPGFEDKLIGVKPGEEREFTLEFPKEYGVQALQGRNVTFKVTATKVNEVVLPKEDDAFAAKAGPFKSLDELKSDVRKQITSEREYQNDRDYESELLSKITDQSTVAVPDSLIEEELTRLEQEERQNVTYRGQTWEEHLAEEGVSEEQHRAKNRPGAELRVKAGLVLAEIAEKEQVEVQPDELAMRTQLLKGQYQDPAMQSELDKPENRRELASRMLSEKTIAQISAYAEANNAAGKTDKANKPAKTKAASKK